MWDVAVVFYESINAIIHSFLGIHYEWAQCDLSQTALNRALNALISSMSYENCVLIATLNNVLSELVAAEPGAVAFLFVEK